MTTIKTQIVYQGSDGGDYIEVNVLIDDELYVTYGSHYDDKGRDKAEGFIDGYVAAMGSVNTEYEDLVVHDEDYPEDCECDDCIKAENAEEEAPE